MEAQARIVPALCALHNILVNIGEEDLELTEDPQVEDSDSSETVQGHRGFVITNAESQRAGLKRDGIAAAMWTDYQARRDS